MKLPFVAALAALLFGGHQVPVPHGALPPDPVPMPADRADDSYAIYSLLLPGGNIEWADAKRTVWLVEELTKTQVAPDEPCLPPADAGRFSATDNPHNAIKPPLERQSEFQAVLTDFDLHCHQRITLQHDRFHTALPVWLLDRDAMQRYTSLHAVRSDADVAKEFAGSAGMHSFSQVYFNPGHTLAMVYTGMWCGGLCGNWTWVPLEKKDGNWHKLAWPTTITIS